MSRTRASGSRRFNSCWRDAPTASNASFSIPIVHLPNAASSHHDLHQRQGIRKCVIYKPNTFSFSAIILDHAAHRLNERLRTYLRHEQTISLLEGNSMSIDTVSTILPAKSLIKSWRPRPYLEYLSSGEKRAGWADLVTSPAWTFLRV